MQQMIADKNQLKEVFKQAFTELLQEQRDFLYDVLWIVAGFGLSGGFRQIPAATELGSLG